MAKQLVLLLIIGGWCASIVNLMAQNGAGKVQPKTAKVYVTASGSSLRLTATETVAFKPLDQPLETQTCVFVDPKKTFQTYVGIGAALTDASAETFAKLSPERKQAFIDAHFDREKGIGYTIARTNINSCDFSSDMYTYVAENDKELKTFDIGHDEKYKIPFIKAAMEAAKGKLKLFASPWSPPAFMKSNKDMLQGGTLLPEYYGSWAKYFTKFIAAYEKRGIPVWGITIQNEPMAKQKWESCIFTAAEETNFLKKYLGPQMAKAGYGGKKIIVWDHNRDLIYQRATTYLADPEAAKYFWGIGYHWYEDWSGGTPMFDNIRRVQEAFPNKHLFFTEGCAESFDAKRYQAWELGEEYGRSMINDFNNGMVGFTDWNILLDETGGPNHVQNFCFAPVHADFGASGELIFTNAYYYIGHFSKFIEVGAKRIACATSRSNLLATAFKNPDGKIVVVMMNQGKEKTSVNLWMEGKSVELSVLPRSIQTIVY